jgi:hypothetical protein
VNEEALAYRGLLRQKKNAIDSEWILRFGEIILKG